MKSICFAYYGDNKFLGWYADSFGSVRNCPKLYSDLEQMRPIITKSLTNKLKKINESSFSEAKEKVTGVLEAIGLATFDSEDLLRNKNIELRVVECPEYDGPNINFDREAYKTIIKEQRSKMIEEGIYDIPASKERSDRVAEFHTRFPSPKCDNWTYADFTELPGSPKIGDGKTEADAIATLFIRNKDNMHYLDFGYLEINGKPYESLYKRD